MPPAIGAVAAAVPAITGALATPLIAAGGTTLLTVGGAVSLAASVGVTALSARLAQSQLKKASRGFVSNSPVNNTAELSLPQREANPARRIIFGRAITSGAYFFSEAVDDFLYLGFLLAAHECDAIEELFINDRAVKLDINGQANEAPFYDGVTVFAEASYRLGTANQAIDPILDAAFSSLSDNFRQRGHTTAVVKLRQGANQADHLDLYGDRLAPRFRIRGIKAYDPRDASQSETDTSTWKWTDNAALLLMRYLTLPNTLGAGLSTNQIDWQKAAAGADVCDKFRPTLAGAEKQYTANGVALSTDSRFDIVEALETAMSGSLILNGRMVYPLPASRRQPVRTLHDGLVMGAINYVPQQPRAERPNVARIEVVDPENDYQIITGPTYRDEDAIAQDGEQVETQRYAFVLGDGNAARAQRLAKFAVQRAQLGRSINASFVESSETAVLEPGDIVRVDFRATSFMNGIYEVKSKVPTQDFSAAEYVLVEWDNSSLDWNPANDEQVWIRSEESVA